MRAEDVGVCECVCLCSAEELMILLSFQPAPPFKLDLLPCRSSLLSRINPPTISLCTSAPATSGRVSYIRSPPSSPFLPPLHTHPHPFRGSRFAYNHHHPPLPGATNASSLLPSCYLQPHPYPYHSSTPHSRRHRLFFAPPSLSRSRTRTTDRSSQPLCNSE